MASLYHYGLDVLAELHNPNNIDNNMINQSVQVMPSSEQSSVVNHSETEITNDSNIIPYSHYCSQNDFKKEESRNIDREIALQNKIKLLDNIVYKRDQSAQTVHMLTKPKFFYDHSTKQALEETLMLAEESHSKMLLKQQDQMVLEKKVNTTPVDYAVLNQFSQDFKKRFVPQTKLSAEQAFCSLNFMNSSDPSPSCRPTKVEVPKELPKFSMSVEISDLNANLEEKGLIIAALKDDLRKLKGKALVDNVVTPHTIAPEILKIDVKPIAPRLLNNRTAHPNYLRLTQEQVALLRENNTLCVRKYCVRDLSSCAGSELGSELTSFAGTLKETLTEGTKGALHLRPERPRVYADLASKEKDRYNADIRATNILLQGLPKDIYSIINHYTDAKNIWDNVKMLLEGLELTKEDRKSQLFVTAVKLNRGLRDSDYDQLYAYLKQHKVHTNENKKMLDQFTQHTVDPLALMSNVSNQQHYPYSSTTSPSKYIQPHSADTTQLDSGLSPTKNLIKNLTNTLAILTQSYKTYIPQTNNQLRTSLNLRNQATIQDDRCSWLWGAQNRVGYANPGQARQIKCYNCKVTVDEDVGEQPVHDLALNVDNVFQADEYNAFDSDVDEAPTAQTLFMANLSFVDPVYDEVGPYYDSDVLFEVHDHDHYQDVVCEHHEVHDMHEDVQPNYVVDSHIDYTSDSNMIMYDQYVKDNAVQVVQSNVSAIPNDACMMILNDMHEPPAQHVSVTTQYKVVDKSLTAELATYKEQVELYERRARFKLTEKEQNIDEQLRIVITDGNIKEEKLKKELHYVKMQLASTIHHNKSMVEEVTSLKKDFKQKENTYLEEFLDMKALKEKVDDKLIKQDQSIQTVYMLCKPKPYYDEQRKVAIGYKSPLCLTRAKQVQPALYNGNEIIKTDRVPP
nr:hypothetical protein [Tanacetum cinerariifolium]